MTDFKSNDVPANPGFIRPSLKNINVIGGDLYLQYRVRGFWGSPVSLRIRRFYGEGNMTGWEMREISNSSGGHEDNVTFQERAENFAAAIMDAVVWSNTFTSTSNYLEGSYVIQMDAERKAGEERKAKRKIDLEAHEAALQADPEVGADAWKEALQDCRDAMKLGRNVVLMSATRTKGRSAQNTRVFRPVHGSAGRLVWEYGSIRDASYRHGGNLWGGAFKWCGKATLKEVGEAFTAGSARDSALKVRDGMCGEREWVLAANEWFDDEPEA